MPNKKKTLGQALKKAAKHHTKKPLWKGPEVDGVTQSMLNDFLFCRERFRVRNILGLAPPERFECRLEYGNMWHVCEEAYCKRNPWKTALRNFVKGLAKQFPNQQEQVAHWYRVCLTQFPFYIEHWKKHTTKQKMLMAEKVFCVPYTLPSGRVVLLWGKWDGAYTEKKQLVLKENKTKGTIDEESLRNQLLFDLQTMTYITALSAYCKDKELQQPSKILYNVVRRPLSGGKGSIRRLKKDPDTKKEETLDHFYARLGKYIHDDPAYFFMRWEVQVSQRDIATFRNKFLDPILEQLCDWYEWIAHSTSCNLDSFQLNRTSHEDRRESGYAMHYRTPFGIWNPLARGATTEYDHYLATGSTVGLERKDRLFKELD